MLYVPLYVLWSPPRSRCPAPLFSIHFRKLITLLVPKAVGSYTHSVTWEHSFRLVPVVPPATACAVELGALCGQQRTRTCSLAVPRRET